MKSALSYLLQSEVTGPRKVIPLLDHVNSAENYGDS